MAEDSIEHYMCCHRLHQYGRERLRLGIPEVFAERGVHFMLLAPESSLPAPVLTRRALLLTAAYKLHCKYRRGRPFEDPEVLRRAIAHAVQEAALGHTGA